MDLLQQSLEEIWNSKLRRIRDDFIVFQSRLSKGPLILIVEFYARNILRISPQWVQLGLVRQDSQVEIIMIGEVRSYI